MKGRLEFLNEKKLTTVLLPVLGSVSDDSFNFKIYVLLEAIREFTFETEKDAIFLKEIKLIANDQLKVM